jgi:hypothetical protein
MLASSLSLLLQRKDGTHNRPDKIKLNWTECNSACPSRSRHPRRGQLPGIEVDTRVRYDTLGINGLAGSTAIGILVEHDITLIFDELGRTIVSLNLSYSIGWNLILTLQVRMAWMTAVQPPGVPRK